MKNFETTFANFVLNNRLICIFFPLVIITSLIMGNSQLYFDSSYRVFFSDKNPELLAFEAIEKTYTKDDNVIVVLTPKSSTLFTSENLHAIENLTRESWQVPYSNRVDSISNFQRTKAYEDDLIVADMIKDALSLDDKTIVEIKNAVLSEPALVNRLISPNGNTTGVVVTLQIPIDKRTESTMEIANSIRKIVSDFKEAHPNFNTHISGTMMMDATFSELGISDSMTLLPTSFLIMVAILALLVGRFFGTLVTTTVILLSIGAAMGASGFLGFPITSVTTSAPVIILTVAVANCVHILVTFFDNFEESGDKVDAMKESLRINLQPVFLASVTTAIGFLTLNTSEVPPFNHLGNIVSIGILISFILSVSLLPATLTLMPLKRPRMRENRTYLLSSIAEFIIRKRRLVLTTTVVLIIIAISNIPRNELNDIFVHWFDESVQFRQSADYMEENLTGIYVVSFSLSSGESGGISSPKFQRDIENFSVWLESQPETVHVDRFTTIMKRLNKNMHQDEQSFYKLPESRELAAQYLLLYEMSLPYGLDLNNQINVDKSSARVNLTTKTISTKETLELNEKALTWLENNADHIQVAESAGTVLMFSNIGQRNIRAMLTGTTIAIFLISALLMIALRSLKIGLISLVANLVPAGIGFGLWGIFVGQVGLSLSIVTGMTFGIVIDDSVHFLSKYLRARREKQLGVDDSVRYSFNTVGKALVVTTFILVVGFSVLATSSFLVNSAMGTMTAIIISIALVTTFLLLPPLLIQTEGK